ncbi:MAG: PQQ-binding-like beta-propeller repeat protein [Desulfomonile sp.]
MISDDLQLPPGFRIVRILSDGFLFKTVHVKGPEGDDSVYRILRPELSRNLEIMARFEDFFGRYQSIIQFSHLPKVHSTSTGNDGLLYLWEEYVKGKPLSLLIKEQGTLDPVPLLQQVCEALHYAHQKQVFHLCVTPERVLVGEEDRKIKLIGFGLAAVPDRCTLLPSGLKKFVAPEVLAGSNCDERSDVFSIGAMIQDLFPDRAAHPDLLRAVAPLESRYDSPRSLKSKLLEIFSDFRDKPSPRIILVPKIQITTDPPGADIRVGGKLIGTTDGNDPYKVAVAWDEGEITIEKSGFKKVSLSYSESPEEYKVHLTLIPGTVGVTIITEPIGARVVINEEDWGVTDDLGLQLHLPLGKKTIVLSKPGYTNSVFFEEFTEDQTVTIGPVKLSVRSLNIVSEPEGAEVSVGERLIGTTSSQGLLVPWNEGPIVIDMHGYQTETIHFSSAPAETELRIKLKPLLVFVVIVTNPPGAMIEVDGARLGKTKSPGLEAELNFGSRKITVKKLGYQTKELVEWVAGPETVHIGPIYLEKGSGTTLVAKLAALFAVIGLGIAFFYLSPSFKELIQGVLNPSWTQPVSEAGEQWGFKYRSNLRNTGVFYDKGAPLFSKVAWRFDTGGPVVSSPCFAKGVVFVGSKGGSLYAVNSKNGILKWAFKTRGAVVSSPAVSDGIVYVGSEDGNLYAVDVDSGKQKWLFETGRAVISSPAVVDKVVYFGSLDGHFYAVEALSGKIKWNLYVGHEIRSSLAIADKVAYFGTEDGHLYAVDCNTGRVNWDFETAQSVTSSPAFDNGIVYFGCQDGSFYALDVSARNIRWKVQTGNPFISSPAVFSKLVCFGSGNGSVYAVDLTTGEVKWTFNTGASVESSPSIANGTLYFGSGDRQLYAVKMDTGQENWKFKTGKPVVSSPAIVEGVVYVGSSDGSLYAIH